MIDYRYSGIRFLQKIVSFSNWFQKRFFSDTKISLNGNEKLLLIKLDRIGDAVWSVYFSRILKESFPQIKLYVIANDYNEFVFQENKELFEDIVAIKQLPPNYLVKNFNKSVLGIFDMIKVKIENKELINYYKNIGIDYVLNFTGRKYVFFAKSIGRSIGGGFGLLNFIYEYPLIGHNEIGTNKHIVDKWLNKFKGVSKLSYKISYESSTNYKSVLLFLGGKMPGKLPDSLFSRIKNALINNGCKVVTISDDKSILADYYLSKDYTFMVGDSFYSDFLSKFDFMIGIDGGVLHYSSQFIRVVSLCASTNYLSAYPYGADINLISNFDELTTKIFSINYGKHYLITNILHCTGCFQVGCLEKLCLKSLDIGIEIVIKFLTFVIYEQSANSLKINKNQIQK